MAGGRSDYLEKKVADHVLGNTAYSAPATVYIALFQDQNTKAQRDAGTVTEASGTGYGRVAVTNNTTNWPNASGIDATKQNGTAFVFGVAGSNWGNCYAVGIYDAITTGNLLNWLDFLSTEQVFQAATSDTCTAYAHGYSDGDYVKVSALPIATLPAGLTDGAYYYIINSATDTFKLSLTNGGSAVDITAAGAAKIGKSAHITVNVTNVVTLAINDITLTED